MKYLIILAFLTFFHVNTEAQSNNYYASMRMGYSLPLGEFASHEFGYGGYALLGKTFGLEGSYFISKNLGIGLDVSMKEFRFASGYYLLDYIASEPAFSSLDMLAGTYKVKSFLVGPYYKLELSKRMTTDFRLLGGITISNTPDQLFTAEAFSVGKTYFWKTSAQSTSATVLTGLSVNYKIFDHVLAGLNFDFSYTRAKYTFIRGSSKYYDYLHIPLFQLVPALIVTW